MAEKRKFEEALEKILADNLTFCRENNSNIIEAINAIETLEDFVELATQTIELVGDEEVDAAKAKFVEISKTYIPKEEDDEDYMDREDQKIYRVFEFVFGDFVSFSDIFRFFGKTLREKSTSE